MPDNVSNFDFLLLNAQSLNVETVDGIIVDYSAYNLKFMCITETWCSGSQIYCVAFPNHRLVCEFSRTRSIRGGVAIWCRTDMEVVPIDTSAVCREIDIEIVGLQWKVDIGHSVYVFCCYRSPSGSFDTFLLNINTLLDKYFKRSIPVVLMGDFNENSMSERQAEAFRDLLSGYGLGPRVTEPTRVTTGCSSIIDQIYTGLNTRSSSQVKINSFSDHRTVLFRSDIESKTSNSLSISRRIMRGANIQLFRNALSSETWQDVFEATDVNSKFSCFHGTFIRLFEYFFPLRRVKCSRQGASWVSSEVKDSSARLKDLYNLQLKYPNLKNQYVLARKRHNILISETKKDHYFRKICFSGNINRAAWRVTSELTNKTKPRVNITLSEQGLLLEDPSLISERFNEFFQEAPQIIRNGIPRTSGDPLNFRNRNVNSMFFRPVLENEVLSVIRNRVKAGSSCGPDGVPGFLLKRIAESIVLPITHLINCSLCEGIFPSTLKVSTVVPIFKKGCKSSKENYRPISLVSVFSKIFEYVVLDQLFEYLEKNDILDPAQHGFRRERSTLTAVRSYYQELIENVDRGGSPIGIFCDLSRAFDCVDHTILCGKLSRYGIRGVPLDWFESYLSGRSQRVRIDHSKCGVVTSHFSSPLPISMGVPQGTVLAPLLFLIFINDLPSATDGYTVMYADDTTKLVAGPSQDLLGERVSEVFNSLSKWFSSNLLYLNAAKTKIMQFHTRQRTVLPPVILHPNCGRLKLETGASFLGVYFDDTLSFKKHCSNLAGALNSACYQIRILRSVLNIAQLRNFYCACVQTRLSFGLLIWGQSPGLTDVFLLQKRIIRCIFDVSSLHSCRGLFKKLKVLPLASLYIYEHLLCVYKDRGKYKRVGESHMYDTRSSSKFCVPFRHLSLCMSTSDTLGLRLFNSLPDDIRNCASLRKFKIVAKSYLLEGCFYSVQEYFNQR